MTGLREISYEHAVPSGFLHFGLRCFRSTGTVWMSRYAVSGAITARALTATSQSGNGVVYVDVSFSLR